jgi:hypothetical protein
VRHIVIAGSAETIDSARIAFAGTDFPEGATVLDAELTPSTTSARAHASGDRDVELAGGHVVLARPDGTHLDADVVSGHVRVHRTGRGAHARAHASGSINVRVRLPHVEVARPAPPVRHRRAPSTRERDALAGLLAARPAGSLERARLATAIDRVSNGLEDGPVMFYNIPIVGHSIALVVDVSYSMRDPDPQALGTGDTPSKLDMLRAQLVRLLASLPSDVAVNIVAFSSASQPMWDRPRVLDPDALQSAITWVSALRPIDETHPLDAVRLADNAHADQIILLTDGRPTFATEEEPALLQLAATFPTRGARLDCVGIGPDQDTAFLDALALRAHGIAFHE